MTPAGNATKRKAAYRRQVITFMQIDRDNGTVRLFNGLEIDPAMTQDAFRALPAGRDAQPRDYGTHPWIHYQLSGGRIDDHDLIVSLCFYDQMLVYVNMSVDLYPPGPKDWSNYSLDVEAATKQFHDRLLAGMLGEPSTSAAFLPGGMLDAKETLGQPLRWDFAWGAVSSYHDSKGGGTFMTVSYGNRRQEASEAYRQRRIGS